VRLLLLRHGRTAWNDSGRFQGQADPPLDAVGQAQAARVGPVIAAMRPDVVVSSDLLRCAATAAAIGLPYRPDARLREIDLGHWSGLTSAEAHERFPAEDAAWRRGDDIRRGGGETYLEVARRAGTLLDEIVAGLPPDADSLVVFVLHGGSARSLIGRVLGLPPHTWWHFGPLRNCHWTVLTAEHGRFRIYEHNVSVPRPDRVGAVPVEGTVGALLPSQASLADEDVAAASDTDPIELRSAR